MSTDINTLYTDILAFAGMAVDENGCVYTPLNGEKQFAVVKGLPIVLPTEQHLRTANIKEKLIFHPLSENILNQGEPEMVLKLRKCINIRLNYVFGILAQSLLTLAASPKIHQQLSPDQTELLVVLKDVDDTTRKHWAELLTRVFAQKKSFVEIYVRYGGTYKGNRYFRIGVTSFPIYDDLKPEKGPLLGVSLRNKDRAMLRELYRFILPGIDQPEQYSFGSNSNTAPYLEALMRAAMNVASRFNTIVDQYRDYIFREDDGVSLDQLTFTAQWVEAFDNLDALLPLIHRIPSQEVSAMLQTPPPAPSPIPTPAAPTYPLPAPSPAPTQAAIPAFQPPAPPAPPPVPNLQYTAQGTLDFKSLEQMRQGMGGGINPFAAGWMPPQGYTPPGYGAPPPYAPPGYGPPGYPPGYQPGMPLPPQAPPPYGPPGYPPGYGQAPQAGYGPQGYPYPPGYPGRV